MPEIRPKVQTTYYSRHWQEILDRSRKWRREHHYDQRTPVKISRRNFAIRRRNEVIEFLGGKCIKCGYNVDKRALQIDHINGGGNKEIRSFPSYATYLKHILEVKGNGYQLLCANCNAIKRMDNYECQSNRGGRLF